MSASINQPPTSLSTGNGDERPTEPISVGMEVIAAIFREISELRRKVDSLEQAHGVKNGGPQQAEQSRQRQAQDPGISPSPPNGEREQGQLADEAREGPAPSAEPVVAENPCPGAATPGVTDLIEFRSRSWQKDGKPTDWLITDLHDDKALANQSLGGKNYGYDIDEERRFAFRVSNTAALYQKFFELCPPGSDGDVTISQNELVFRSVYSLIHCIDCLREYKKELEAAEPKKRLDDDNEYANEPQSAAAKLPSAGGQQPTEGIDWENSSAKKKMQEIEVLEQLYELGGHWGHIKSANKRLKSLREKKKIDCDSVRGLFHLGDLVVFRELRDEWVVAKVTSVTAANDHREYFLDRDIQLVVQCKAIDFNGNSFQYHHYYKTIAKFTGSKSISELEFYPLKEHKDWQRLVEKSIEYGKRWWKLHKQFVSPKQHESSNEAVQPGASTTERKQPEYRNAVMHYSGYCETFEEGGDREESSKGSKLDSRVIVDPSRYSDRGLKFANDNTIPDFSECLENFNGPPEQNIFALCPETVLVHSLSDNQWYLVAMSRLVDPIWATNAWKRLVKPPDNRRLAKSITRIKELAAAHKEAKNAADDKDNKNNFKGKGKGLTFLLHGPPGVGKTMLAECLSEVHKRPLYRINVGQLTTGVANWESRIDEIFRQAHEWDAILLLDEAEVILAERTQENMQQSAWVAVFLRKIEYFEGIIFLTTNLIHMIDTAFISRVNLGFKVDPMSKDLRTKIWQQRLNELVEEAGLKAPSKDSVAKWADNDLNGRQIRNVIHTAHLLTRQKIPQEGIEMTIQDAIDDVIGFKNMIQKEQKDNKWREFHDW